MIPSEEQVDRAIAAFDETWRKRPDITVKNFEEARRDAMRSALGSLVKGTRMNELVERLEELRTQATPGPWKPDVQEGVRGHCILAQIWDSEGFSLAIIDTKDEASVANANAALITTLVNNLDTIIAALRERDMVRVPSRAASDVLAERRRQVEAEGWTPEHDDQHDDGSLADAAATFVLLASGWDEGKALECWPPTWSQEWIKADDERRRLVKAAALIVAEIEQRDRAMLPASPTLTMEGGE